MSNHRLRSALANFKASAEAPEGCYEDAKALNTLVGETCDNLMRELRAMGLKASATDLAFDLEAAIYDYARRSNPDATVFPIAEGVGSSLLSGGPARDRMLARARHIHIKDFLTSFADGTLFAPQGNAESPICNTASFNDANMIDIPSHVEIDVRRPDGAVETVHPRHPREPDAPLKMITEREFLTMKAATAAAGRGELLAYRNVTRRVEAPKPSVADLAEMDDIRRANAIYRASAGGEPCDQIGGPNDIDRTPRHSSDR